MWCGTPPAAPALAPCRASPTHDEMPEVGATVLPVRGNCGERHCAEGRAALVLAAPPFLCAVASCTGRPIEAGLRAGKPDTGGHRVCVGGVPPTRTGSHTATLAARTLPRFRGRAARTSCQQHHCHSGRLHPPWTFRACQNVQRSAHT